MPTQFKFSESDFQPGTECPVNGCNKRINTYWSDYWRHPEETAENAEVDVCWVYADKVEKVSEGPAFAGNVIVVDHISNRM